MEKPPLPQIWRERRLLVLALVIKKRFNAISQGREDRVLKKHIQPRKQQSADHNRNQNFIVIGNPLIWSPDFPPRRTVRETFASHGAPSRKKRDLCLSLHGLLSPLHWYCGTALTGINTLIRQSRFRRETPHWNASPLTWALPVFHVPITLSLDVFRCFL